MTPLGAVFVCAECPLSAENSRSALINEGPLLRRVLLSEKLVQCRLMLYPEEKLNFMKDSF